MSHVNVKTIQDSLLKENQIKLIDAKEKEAKAIDEATKASNEVLALQYIIGLLTAGPAKVKKCKSKI